MVVKSFSIKANNMANIFKIGQTVTYSHYGVSQSAKITRMSESGEVLFLDNGGWKHAISCKPEAAVKVIHTLEKCPILAPVFATSADQVK